MAFRGKMDHRVDVVFFEYFLDLGAVGDVSAMRAVDGYDGGRELWWPSVADVEAARARDARAARSLFQPETIDVAGSFALVARERVIVPGSSE